MRDAARKIKEMTQVCLHGLNSTIRVTWSTPHSVQQGERIGPSLGNIFTEGFEITRLNKRVGRENIT